MNRTLDYIRDHFGEELNLTELAKVACFSKYHFHRIFHELLGETVNQHVRRVRLERAVRMLTLDKDKSVVNIALDCGFSSSQNFAKAFKAYFGVTPTYVRREFAWDRMKSRLGKTKGVPQDVLSQGASNTDRGCLHTGPSIERIVEQQPPMAVRVTEMPAYRVAYVRTIGPYCLETVKPAFVQLLRWAEPRGLINEMALFLGAFRNDPNITPVDKCIYDACITIPESVRSDGRINVQSLWGGKYAVYHCEIDPHGHHEAWMKLFVDWLVPGSYQPDSRPSYEIIYNITEEYPLRRHVVDLCLPIKPA